MMNYSNSGKNWEKKMNGPEQDHIDKNTFLQNFVFHSKNKAVIIDEKKKKPNRL